MRSVSVVLASALMLGGMSMAYAQGGPPQKEGGPAQAQQQQAPSGGASRGAGPQGNQGRGSEAGPRAERGGGEGQRSAGQGKQDGGDQPRRQQAQDDGGQKQKDGARASKQDDGEGKRAQRKDDSKDAKRADRDDDRSKDSKRAESKDDQTKDAKRAESKDDDTRDAKRADSKDDQAKDAKRASKDDQGEDAKRAEGKDDRADDKRRADTQDGDAKRVQLSGDREERVRSAFRKHTDVRERTNVDIDINIGRRLPRDWDYYPVPAAIVEIVPEYRDYRYVYVEDRYVIVHPTTYEVVTVIDSSGGRTYAGGSGRCPSDLSLSDEERDYLLQTVQMRNVDVGSVTIGMGVPDSIELHTFPDPVIERVSVLRSCRYFVAEDRIAIVDPNQHEVVVLID